MLSDEGEPLVLASVPLAGAGWQVINRDGDTYLVRQRLQLTLPQANPNAIAAAAISGDQLAFGAGITGVAALASLVRQNGRIA